MIFTTMGNFTEDEFIGKCNEGSFPENLNVLRDLSLREYEDLTALPKGMSVQRSLLLKGCTSLRALPDGLKVGIFLDIRNCNKLKSLPKDLTLGASLLFDEDFLRRIPYRDIPKLSRYRLAPISQKSLNNILQGE